MRTIGIAAVILAALALMAGAWWLVANNDDRA